MLKAYVWKAALLALLFAHAPCRQLLAQKPLVDDDRAYSSTAASRGYVAARCAALYTEFAQELAGDTSSAAVEKAKEKAAAAHDFLRRVSPPQENVFLQWSGEYRARMSQLPRDPVRIAKTLWGQDYDACGGVLGLIRDGDHMERYNRRELRYLMGGTERLLP